MKLRNDRAVLRSTYLFGGLPLTKSEIRKVKIVPRRQPTRCRAGYGGPETETMEMYLTKVETVQPNTHGSSQLQAKLMKIVNFQRTTIIRSHLTKLLKLLFGYLSQPRLLIDF